MASISTECFAEGTRHTAWRDDRPVGYIDVHTADNQMRVLYVCAHVKGRGVGTLLLEWAVRQARQLGVQRISLDDTSDRYGQPDNLYVRAGFRYVEPGYPDMVKCLNS